MLPEELKSMSLDLETGEFLLNGEKMENVDFFVLEFDSGTWSLTLRQHKTYLASGRAILK